MISHWFIRKSRQIVCYSQAIQAFYEMTKSSTCFTYYPYIHVLLQSCASLPDSTATPERTFSAMKILKSYFYFRLTAENTQELSMTYIHTDIPINKDEVTSHFSVKIRDCTQIL